LAGSEKIKLALLTNQSYNQTDKISLSKINLLCIASLLVE